MFNKRSFLLGLGVGIIVGAMLLQLFNLGESSQDRLDEIGQQIEQGGLPSATAGPSATDAEPEAEKNTASPAPSGEPTAVPTDATATEDLAATQAPSETPGVQAEEPNAEPQPFVVRIEPGMSLTETAELLLQSDAIGDAESFISEMKSSGLQVRAGYFLFNEGTVEAKRAASIVSGEPISLEQAEQYEIKKP